ncbi:MAG: ankyrin repeat domain-containing protein [Planctomycetes bacterium]|nr:ankyrin repeat domain-containing protein [Planctomycetota bacterium]
MFERIADGRTDLVFEVIAQGQPATASDGNGVSLLAWCAYYGDVSAMRHLLAHGAVLGSLGDNLDLNGAAFHGHWRLCQFLIEQGADADHALIDTGETPLHAALCKAGRPAYDHVVRVLLAGGAKPDRATRPGATTGAFMRDCRTRGETPLHRAAAFASADAIELLIAAGASRTARDMNGDSPLSWASWHLRPAAILRLLCHGEHTVSEAHVARSTSDHGLGWGNGMETSLLGRPH